MGGGFSAAAREVKKARDRKEFLMCDKGEFHP